MRIARFALLSALFIAACGGDDDDTPPGVTPPPPCDFNEAADATNDGAAELTNFTDVGMNGKTLCGHVDPGHFDGVQYNDTDTYKVTTSGAPILVHFGGGDGAAALPDFSVRITDMAGSLIFERRLDAGIADHVAAVTNLPPSDYLVSVTALDATDRASSVDYKVQFLPDDPARCPKSTDAATYNETNDGAANTGNDGFTINWSDDPAITAASSPAEDSGISLDPTSRAHITGMMGNTDAADEYLDQDAYAFTTGEDTNEMSIRVDWAGAGADLDYVVIEDGQTVLTQESDTSDTTGDEFATFALKPSTKYVVWVGAHDGSGSLPMPYDVSLCGAGFKY